MNPWAELTHGFTIQTRHGPLRKVGEYARSKLRSEARLAVIALNISCRSVAAKVLAYEFHDRGRKVRRVAASRAGKSPRLSSRRSTLARTDRSHGLTDAWQHSPDFLCVEEKSLPDLAERDWPTVNDPELDHIEMAHSANRLFGTMYPPGRLTRGAGTALPRAFGGWRHLGTGAGGSTT
jgi:hypothetical protein